MRIVLDTNVLVSGLLQALGPSGQIVRLVAAGRLELCIDPRIMAEYRDVLRRPKFGFEARHVETLLDFVEDTALRAAAHPLPFPLPDSADEAFLEVAVAGSARCLVTGNIKHFPAECRAGMPVLTPAQFLALLRSESLPS